MEEYLSFALSAPLITMLVVIIRRLFPTIDGDWVPRLVVTLTTMWGGVLVYDGHFTGSVAEFIIAVTAVSAGSIGLNRLDKITHNDNVSITVDESELKE